MNELQSNLSQSRSDSQKNDGTAPGRADEWRSLVAAAVIGIFLIVAAQPGFGKTRKEAELTVESIPSGALVTIRKTSEPTKGTHRVVAGETPLSKRFKFSKKSTTWLQLEKRGFEAMTIEVNSTTGHVMARLIPVEDRSINELQPPPLVERISVLEPAFDVTLRKFSSEEHSDSKSASGRKALSETIRAQLSNYFTVVSDWTDSEEISLSSVWRDARSAMVLGDPIGHAYLAIAPRLETRTARRKLQQFGEELGIDALLIVAGHQNEETGGMKAGKVGIMVAGTAASFGSGYSNAMSSGDAFFTYNIYLPSFAEGAVLQAVLLHCATGEILWVNKGVWKAISFEQQTNVSHIVKDLLTGIESVQNKEKENQ